MTIEEWTTAYALQFGSRANAPWQPGEKAFVESMRKDLNLHDTATTLQALHDCFRSKKIEEWAIAYVLQFGRNQAFSGSYMEGEEEFLLLAAADTGTGGAVIFEVRHVIHQMEQQL